MQISIIDEEHFNRLKSEQIGGYKVTGLESKYFQIPHFEIQPIPGTILEENFPLSDDYYKGLYEHAKEYFSRFPECCDFHRPLLNAPWFKKTDFDYVPLKVVITINYTWHCINMCIDKPDWLARITDYFDIAKQSFGQLPDGFGSPVGMHAYVSNLLRNIENNEAIAPEKRTLLCEHLKSFVHAKETDIEAKPDLGELFRIYREWLNYFPFQLSYFQKLKEEYAVTLPFIKETTRPNIYTNIAKAIVVQPGELVSRLIQLSKKLLGDIDTNKLLKDGTITDVSKTTMEIMMEHHKVTQLHLLGTYFNGSVKKFHFVKDWLFNEKNFFADLSSMILAEENEKLKEKQKNEMMHNSKNEVFTYFDKLILEITTLEIKNIEIKNSIDVVLQEEPDYNKPGIYLSLDHYSQSKSEYEQELKILHQLVLNYLTTMPSIQLKAFTNRLSQLNQSFNDFWKRYSDFHAQFIEAKLKEGDLLHYLSTFFIVPKYQYGIITHAFLIDLHDAVMFKQAHLIGLLTDTISIFNKKPDSNLERVIINYFDIDELIKEANEIPDLISRIDFFSSWRDKFLRGPVAKNMVYSDVSLDGGMPFPDACNMEIERLKEIMNLGQVNASSANAQTCSIKNNFDNVEMKLVIEHFKTGLVNKNYITADELFTYLDHAFNKRLLPGKKIVLKGTPTKQKVISVFYKYYTDVAGKPHGKQPLYAALLGDYFEGYQTTNVSTNFGKAATKPLLKRN